MPIDHRYAAGGRRGRDRLPGRAGGRRHAAGAPYGPAAQEGAAGKGCRKRRTWRTTGMRVRLCPGCRSALPYGRRLGRAAGAVPAACSHRLPYRHPAGLRRRTGRSAQGQPRVRHSQGGCHKGTMAVHGAGQGRRSNNVGGEIASTRGRCLQPPACRRRSGPRGRGARPAWQGAPQTMPLNPGLMQQGIRGLRARITTKAGVEAHPQIGRRARLPRHAPVMTGAPPPVLWGRVARWQSPFLRHSEEPPKRALVDPFIPARTCGAGDRARDFLIDFVNKKLRHDFRVGKAAAA